MEEIRSQSNTSERWIAQSATTRDALPGNGDDVKFRKVRGILNKLTPQTFERLTEELIRIGLDSQVLLKGVILLIFEKALQEPKYVSMYGELCKKLSKKVPNFDPPNIDSTTTFLRLLLNKCQDEYTNRAQASAMYDHRGHLTAEEEEDKLLAKRKMLGNIRFIGELGKLEMLTHSILHKCCEELFKKSKAEDLECLCQIMSTCGHLLDSSKGKYLMDQYFDRMKGLADNDKLPARIRFMIQDVIELRENHWLPRKTISMKETPKPISDIRREAHDELGLIDGTSQDFSYLQIDPRRNGRIFGQKKRTGLEDVFAPAPVGMSSLGFGPGVITPRDKMIHPEVFQPPPPNFRPEGMRTYPPPPQMGMPPPNPHYFHPYKNNGKFNNFEQHQGAHMRRNNQGEFTPAAPEQGQKPPIAPRFMKQALGQGFGPERVNPPLASKEELSFRPPPNSMMIMTPQPMKPTFSKPITSDRINPMPAPIPPPNPPPVEPPEPEPEPTPAPDVINKVEEILKELLQKISRESPDKEHSIPEKLYADLEVLVTKAKDHTEQERESVYAFVVYLVEDKIISGAFMPALKTMLELMGQLETDIPRIKSYVAGFAGAAIIQGESSIAQVAELAEDGKYFPFLLLVLQNMGKAMEKPKLWKMFDESKVNLMSTLPKSEQSQERMAEMLEERELSFLFPLQNIQIEMTSFLKNNGDPKELLEWIKKQVHITYQTSHGFIHALMTVIFKYINSAAAEALKPGQVNEKQVKEKEMELISKYKPVICSFLQERVELQVIAIYAIQSAWVALDCPKVLLLRWFMNTYELDLIEDEAFLKWKEDVRDDIPGKGTALFQVHQWLTWIEEEDDEGDDGEGDD